jgi:hypothetical protein
MEIDGVASPSSARRIGLGGPPAPFPMFTTKTTGNSSPLAACTVVARGERVEMVGDPRQRRVPAVLNAAHEAADLLQVLASLLAAWTAELEGVRALVDDLLDQIRRWNAVDAADPVAHMAARVREDVGVLRIERGHGRGRVARKKRGGQVRRERRKRAVRQPDEAGAQQRRRADVRHRSRQVPQQRDDVLCFVRVEEPEPLVDVCGHSAKLQLLLELAMARTRPEEDCDVSGLRAPGDSGGSIPHGLLLQDSHDLVGHGSGAVVRLGRCADPEHRARPGRRRRSLARIEWKSIRLAIGEVVRPVAPLRHLFEDVVEEREQVGNAAEAPRDRASRLLAGPERLDVPSSLLENGDLRVAEPVDGLLAIADDEDRRSRGEAEPFAPRFDEE